MRRRDLLREAVTGLRHRRLRSALCALGIAIGAAAVVAVVAIPASAQASLLARLGQDGNLLTVSNGRTMSGQTTPLPAAAPGMVRRIDGIQLMAAVGQLSGATVRRTSAVPATNTNGIAVLAADTSIVDTLNLSVPTGRFLDEATGRYPIVVLGAGAARALGIARLGPETQVYLGNPDGRGSYAVVAGILAPVPLAPELDTAALIGTAVATAELGYLGQPSRIYLRADPDRIRSVWTRLAATANPAEPGEVTVGHPSDLLKARATTRTALVGLTLGLGAVALLVGGLGVANVMVVAVLERRSEIGIRRALGASRRAVALIFLIEATLLCLLGACAGTAVGVLATVGYAAVSAGSLVLPLTPLAGALAGSVLVGLVAGLYPAYRAAHLTPTEALRAG